MLKKVILVVISVLSFSLAAQADDTLPDGWRKYPSWDGFNVETNVNSIYNESDKLRIQNSTFLIQRIDSKWQIANNDDLKSLENQDVERLFIDLQNKKIFVLFDTACKYVKNDGIECDCIKLLGKELTASRTIKQLGQLYNICTSNFKDITHEFGMFDRTALSSSTGRFTALYRINVNAVLSAAKEANLLDLINKRYYDEYKNSLTDQSVPIKKLMWLVTQYKNYDPDNLIPAANRRIDYLQNEEAEHNKKLFLEKCHNDFTKASSSQDWLSFISTYTGNDPDQLIPKAKEKFKLAEAREAKEAKLAEAQQHKAAFELAAWRKKIHEGDETNCGPVIEVKPKLIKISNAVAGYGNEHWIRRDQLYPTGYSCRFFNGEYQPPQ